MSDNTLEGYARQLVQSLPSHFPPIELQVYLSQHSVTDEPHLYIFGVVKEGAPVGGYLVIPQQIESSLAENVEALTTFFSRVWEAMVPRYHPQWLERLFYEYRESDALWQRLV